MMGTYAERFVRSYVAHVVSGITVEHDEGNVVVTFRGRREVVSKLNDVPIDEALRALAAAVDRLFQAKDRGVEPNEQERTAEDL
jgi:hypothetical protein